MKQEEITFLVILINIYIINIINSILDSSCIININFGIN